MALPFTIALWPGLVSSELQFPHLQKNEMYVRWLIWCPEYCRWPIKVNFLFSHKSELADVELLDLLGTLTKRLSTTWFSKSQAKVFLIPVALSILRLPKPNLRFLCHKPNRHGQHTLACSVLLSLLHSLLMWFEGAAPSLIQEFGPHCLL